MYTMKVFNYQAFFYFLSEQNCLDIARAFADSRIIDLIKDKMDSLPKTKGDSKGKGGGNAQKPKPAKEKVPK